MIVPRPDFTLPGRCWVLSLAVVVVICGGSSLARAEGAQVGADPDPLALAAQKGAKQHRKRIPRPIELGVSGSNIKDRSLLFCCQGTLGALVEKNGVQYILSNNHVLARTNKGRPGEAIMQPGYGDFGPGCSIGSEAADAVAHLTSRKRIKFGEEKRNKVDVAIAEVIPGTVDPSGAILKIGVPGTEPVNAQIGLEVQKSGRTTGITRGFVAAVDVTAQVGYSEDCDDDTTKIAIFTDVIVVQSFGNKPFSDSGDSGSMVYEDTNRCPAPVGLLFAGTDTVSGIIPAKTVRKIVSRLQPRGPMSFVGCAANAGMEAVAGSRRLLSRDGLRDASAAKRRWEDRLLADPAVHGVGVGMSLSGAVAPAIYLLSDEPRERLRQRLPDQIEGFQVEIIESARMKALTAPSCPG